MGLLVLLRRTLNALLALFPLLVKSRNDVCSLTNDESVNKTLNCDQSNESC